jgi:hypothetical protein
MCYALYLSTNSDEDLTKYDSALVRLERVKAEDEDTRVLMYPNKWYVGSKSGCSCTFRHLTSTELGFGEPVDWAPEEEDEILATTELYRVIRPIISKGYTVDLLDLWVGMDRAEVTTLEVEISAISENTFRLFENHHFVFVG